MINGKRVLALIPARGGSKGIKDKNIYPLNGKPLINYTIETALMSSYVDSVVVTTDSQKIADVAKECGARVPFLRPDYLANDKSKTIDAVLHALDWLSDNDEKYDILVLLQPTQPLRLTEDIDDAVDVFVDNGNRGVASISLVNDHPILMRQISSNGEMTKLFAVSSTVRRQDMQEWYKINGCIYVNSVLSIDANTSFNDNPIPYKMPVERSVDIDEISDIYLAEYYLKSRVHL
ncbi:MAG: acylneuraminate cytidylyltransferase family protein [Lachnospiraceae bacterium]|nr:acylneuraminate cytidylyltransferase family protein [Lachnospiraceae bacterium]